MFNVRKPLQYKLEIGESESTESFESFKSTDHFGGEMNYFSECILNDEPVEPDGEEGLLDVRVIEAALESMRTHEPVKLPPIKRSKRLDPEQVRKLRAVSPPKEVHADSPSK